MRISEIFEDWKEDDEQVYYLPRINIYLKDHGLTEEEIDEVAGMLRGLANAIDGFNSLAGITNKSAKEKERVKFRFSSVENAERFKSAIGKYFSEEVLGQFKAKRVRKTL